MSTLHFKTFYFKPERSGFHVEHLFPKHLTGYCTPTTHSWARAGTCALPVCFSLRGKDVPSFKSAWSSSQIPRTILPTPLTLQPLNWILTFFRLCTSQQGFSEKEICNGSVSREQPGTDSPSLALSEPSPPVPIFVGLYLLSLAR